MIGWLLAAQLSVATNAPDTATSCVPFEITVTARAAGTVPPRLSIVSLGAFQLLGSRSSPRIETGEAVTEGTFVLTTPYTGGATLPRISAIAGAERAVSAPRPISIHRDAGDPDEPRVLVRASLDDGHSRADAQTLFVGQQVDYVVDVQLNEAARRRLRRNPTFFPPDMPALLAYDVAPPRNVARGGVRCFESLTYRRALFPLFPGHIVIPPAALSYGIPLSTSFFSREETREAHTDSVRIDAVDPPAAGRPVDYAGAIGALAASARVSAPSVRMGDPLVLTLRVEGAGNIKLLPRPALSVSWATIAPGEERVEVDTTGAKVTGAKEFDWLLTPRTPGHAQVDSIRYPFFDPARGVYDVARTAPIQLDVAPATLAGADTAITAPARLGIRHVLREERRAPLPDHPAYWLLLALAPLPATVRRARRVRLGGRSGLSAAQRLELAARSRTPAGAREIRRLYLEALRARLPQLQPATSRAPLARQLRRAGVTEATAEAAERLLARLDSAAFSGGGALEPPMIDDARRIVREVDGQAVRARVHGTGAVIVLALLLGGSALLALPTGAERLFGEGVRAYGAGNFALAQRQFARAADRAPRAADAWANMGTAAWSRGDSARASAGWQRALRLDPLDFEVREHLEALHPVSLGARGYVPPVPVDGAAGLALALWLAAWLALAIAPERRPRWVRPVAGGALLVAVIALAAALELRDRLGARGLGVLRTSLQLLDSPVAGAGFSSGGAVGEVGLLGAREGAWVRITLDGARAGWIPAVDVLPLEDAASN